MNRWVTFLLTAFSLIYVALVFSAPAITNSGTCNKSHHFVIRTICEYIPGTPLNEYDKWGSYLSGLLVPLSIFWVLVAFRLQQGQFQNQSDAAIATARTAERQTLIDTSDVYIKRLDRTALNFANALCVVNRNKGLNEYIRGVTYPVQSPEIAKTVFDSWKLVCKRISFEDDHTFFVGNREQDAIMYALTDVSVTNTYIEFFSIFNEFDKKCDDHKMQVLMLEHVHRNAASLRWLYLYSSYLWQADSYSSAIATKLVGWTEEKVARLGKEEGIELIRHKFDRRACEFRQDKSEQAEDDDQFE